MHRKTAHNRRRWIAGQYVGCWLVSQIGGLLGIAVNWQADAAYVGWSAAATALIALIAAAIGFLPGEKGWPRLRDRWLGKPVGLPLALGLCLLLWAWPLEPAYPLDALRWALTVAGGGALAVRRRGGASPTIGRKGFLALLVLALWFSLATIRLYPPIYTDEGWYLNLAWSSAAMGPLYHPSFHLGIHGDPQRIGAPLHLWPIGLWLRLVGLGLWQGRLTMWLFMPLAVAFTYRAARTLFRDSGVGLLAALLTATSTLTLYSAHFIRPEIVLSAVLALALVLHALAEKHQRCREAFALGLLLSLAMTVHTNAFIFCFAFGACYLGRWLWACWRARRFTLEGRLLGLAAGGLVGVAVFAAVYILPDVAAFRQQMNYYYLLNYDETQATLPEVLLDRALTALNHLRTWFAFSLVEGSAVALAGIAALVAGRRADRSLLALLALSVVGLFLVGGRRAPTYITPFVPLGAMLVAGMLARLLAGSGRALIIGALLAAAVGGVSVRQVIVAEREGYNREFERCLAAVKAWLPEEGMILGEHLFWLGRPELTGYASRTLVEVPWPTRSAEAWWAWIDPDIVLWPGPPSGAASQYLQARGYTYTDFPACPTSELTIWLKPGVEPGKP